MRQRVTDYLRRRWRETVGWAAIALGALVAVLGWIGVSGKDVAPLQLPYLASGGVAIPGWWSTGSVAPAGPIRASASPSPAATVPPQRRRRVRRAAAVTAVPA